MRYSLIGREITNDSLANISAHPAWKALSRSSPATSRLSERLPRSSNITVRPSSCPTGRSVGKNSATGGDDIITSYQLAGSADDDLKRRIALESCPGFGSCGGMFTYNTMQTFIGVVGMQPLHMVSPASQDGAG